MVSDQRTLHCPEAHQHHRGNNTRKPTGVYSVYWFSERAHTFVIQPRILEEASSEGQSALSPQIRGCCALNDLDSASSRPWTSSQSHHLSELQFPHL